MAEGGKESVMNLPDSFNNADSYYILTIDYLEGHLSVCVACKHTVEELIALRLKYATQKWDYIPQEAL